MIYEIIGSSCFFRSLSQVLDYWPHAELLFTLLPLAPPTNQSTFHQWTLGAIFYSVIIVAEAFGASNASQIVDTSNNGIFTPSYAIYDNGALARVALFNFNNDPSGASDITASITVQNGAVPMQVKVK